jgi:hypothetical protein
MSLRERERRLILIALKILFEERQVESRLLIIKRLILDYKSSPSLFLFLYSKSVFHSASEHKEKFTL